MLIHLFNHLIKYNFYDPLHSGLRAHHSTNTALLRVPESSSGSLVWFSWIYRLLSTHLTTSFSSSAYTAVWEPLKLFSLGSLIFMISIALYFYKRSIILISRVLLLVFDFSSSTFSHLETSTLLCICGLGEDSGLSPSPIISSSLILKVCKVNVMFLYILFCYCVMYRILFGL